MVSETVILLSAMEETQDVNISEFRIGPTRQSRLVVSDLPIWIGSRILLTAEHEYT